MNRRWIELVRGKFVNGEAAASGRWREWFRRDFRQSWARGSTCTTTSAGTICVDAFFYRVAGGVGLLQARGARDADGDVHEIALAGAAHAHAFRL